MSPGGRFERSRRADLLRLAGLLVALGLVWLSASSGLLAAAVVAGGAAVTIVVDFAGSRLRARSEEGRGPR